MSAVPSKIPAQALQEHSQSLWRPMSSPMLNRKMEELVIERGEGVYKFYSEDVISVGPGEGFTRGRHDLLEAYKKHMTSTVRIVSVHTHLKGNSGLDWANFYITPDDKNEKPFSFKILFLWEKRNGQWWCIGDYFFTGKFPEDNAHEN